MSVPALQEAVVHRLTRINYVGDAVEVYASAPSDPDFPYVLLENIDDTATHTDDSVITDATVTIALWYSWPQGQVNTQDYETNIEKIKDAFEGGLFVPDQFIQTSNLDNVSRTTQQNQQEGTTEKKATLVFEYTLIKSTSSNNFTFTTDDLDEGTSNLYFTGERVDDRVDGLLTEGNDISLFYNDPNDALSISLDQDFSYNAVPFGKSDGELTEDTSNLVWDQDNNQLGVGTGNPVDTLTVDGSFSMRGRFDWLDKDGGTDVTWAMEPIPSGDKEDEFFRLENRNTNVAVMELRGDLSDVTDTTENAEATLALMRGDDSDNFEFLDIFNIGYGSNERYMGLRVQKRGTGLYRPFKFQWDDTEATGDSTDGYSIIPPTYADGPLFQSFMDFELQKDLTVFGNITAGGTSTDEDLTLDGKNGGDIYLQSIASGKVGVNTTTPETNLDVGGSGRVAGPFEVDPQDSTAQLSLTSQPGYDHQIGFTQEGVANLGVLGYQTGNEDLIYKHGTSSIYGGTEIFRADSGGYFVQYGANTAISDSDLNNNQFAGWIDETDNELEFKWKDSGGSVKTASVFDTRIAQFTSTDTSTDYNQSSWTKVKWNSQITLDAGYTHGSATDVTVDTSGTYRVYAMITFDSNGDTRINPGVSIAVNGTRKARVGLSGYIRYNGGHREASNYVEEYLTLNAGDTITIQTKEFGNSGTGTLRSEESILIVERK